LAELKYIARSRSFNEDNLDAASHAVIRRLENLFDEHAFDAAEGDR
jgi:hypothetical protein